MTRRTDRARNTFAGKVAVVTGAGSGIGRALAMGLAERGARLAISDVDEAGLFGTRNVLRSRGANVLAHVLDVADRAAVAAYAETVRGHFGAVHQLYNNAGIAADTDSILSTDYPAYTRILDVNLWGVVHGTKEFLPHLIASGDGRLVNISSINGIFAQNANSAYCTSKFAVRGFTESVRADMIAAGHPVKVTVVHPGGVSTNIASSALRHATEAGAHLTDTDRHRVDTYNAKLLRLPPDQAADIILDGVAANRARILVGTDARVIDKLVRLLPAAAPRLAVWLERRTFSASPDPAVTAGRS